MLGKFMEHIVGWTKYLVIRTGTEKNKRGNLEFESQCLESHQLLCYNLLR